MTAELALDRLVGIGVRAEVDRAALVAAPVQLLAQVRRGVFLVEELGLEIEAGGKIHVLMARAGRSSCG